MTVYKPLEIWDTANTALHYIGLLVSQYQGRAWSLLILCKGWNVIVSAVPFPWPLTFLHYMFVSFLFYPYVCQLLFIFFPSMVNVIKKSKQNYNRSIGTIGDYRFTLWGLNWFIEGENIKLNTDSKLSFSSWSFQFHFMLKGI